MEFITSLLSQQAANILFLVLFAGGLLLATLSIIFGNITDIVGGALDGLDGQLDFSGDGFGWLSFTTICIGISGTGAGGFLFNAFGIPPLLVLLIGLVIGFLCTFCAGRFIIVPLRRRQYNGIFRPGEMVGRIASVIAPMSKGAMGEVLVGGRSLTARPVSPELEFRSGDTVQITRIDGTIAFVDKVGDEEGNEEDQAKWLEGKQGSTPLLP